jgi:polysaccharide export outer membrane protein
MTQRSTILEVLAMAGGLTTFAKKSGIVLIRQDGASSVRVPIDYDALMTGKQWNGGRGNFAVLPGDVIVVR